MANWRKIKLRRDSEGQFIEIPSEFALNTDNVQMRKEGEQLIIVPSPQTPDTEESAG